MHPQIYHLGFSIELKHLRNLWGFPWKVSKRKLLSVPWCFGGDFNAVRLPSERSGLGPFSSAKVYDFFFFNMGLKVAEL